MNRNGFYTSEDLKREVNLKGNCILEIIPCHDGFTYVWLRKNSDKFTTELPISPITQDPTQSSCHLTAKLHPNTYWKHIYSSQEISVRWRTGQEISRHVTIEDVLFWIKENL